MSLYGGLDLSLAGSAGVLLDEEGHVVHVLAFSTSSREVARYAGHKTVRVLPSPEVEQGDARASWARTVWAANQIARWLSDHAAASPLLAIEDHAYGVRTNATYRMGHLHGLVRRDVQRLLGQFLLVEPTTVKLAATGSGRAEKPQMIAAAEADGCSLSEFAATTRHNVADAYWLARCAWAWARLREGKATSLSASMLAVMLPSKKKPGLVAREPMP
jgi:Holliday junction resolvasome RuvABC endonuclease subunit